MAGECYGLTLIFFRYYFFFFLQVSFTDKRAQNKLKHQERAIYSQPLKKFSEENNEGTNINYKCNASDTLANLVPRVLRLLGQRFGRQERLWGNGIISPEIRGSGCCAHA